MDTRELTQWVIEAAQSLKCEGELSPTAFALTSDGKVTVSRASADKGEDPVEMLFRGLQARRDGLSAAAVALDMVVGNAETGERRDAIWLHVEDPAGARAIVQVYDEQEDDITFEEPQTQRCEPRIFGDEEIGADDDDVDVRAMIATPREPGPVAPQMPLPEGADPSPLLVFAETPMMVNIIAASSTLPTYYAATLEDVASALAHHSFCGIFAHSPMNASGSAYKAIARFRKRNPGKLVIYQSWDYRMKIAAKRGLRAKADVLLVGGGSVNELLEFIFKALALKDSGEMPPPDAEWYEAYLRATIPNGTRQEIAKMMRERKLPPSPTK